MGKKRLVGGDLKHFAYLNTYLNMRTLILKAAMLVSLDDPPGMVLSSTSEEKCPF